MGFPPLPALCLALAAGWAAAWTPNPINLFRPETGQGMLLNVETLDGLRHDVDTCALIRKTADSGYFSRNTPSGVVTGALSWSGGVLHAPGLLRTGMLDTAGIRGKRMSFPADYQGTAGGRSYGITLDYSVHALVFDTLLVSCWYMSYLDAGNICDFVTPSGYLAYSITVQCHCVSGSADTPDVEVLEFIRGKPLRARPRAGGPGFSPGIAPAEYDSQGRRLRVPERQGILFLREKPALNPRGIGRGRGNEVNYWRDPAGRTAMCRNIKTLFNFEPPATEQEIQASALQFVRKLSGFNKPSQANEAAFQLAVAQVTSAARVLVQSLVTTSPARNREVERAKAMEESRKRFDPARVRIRPITP